MINCSKCHEPIKDKDNCYQLRFGHWKEEDAQDPGEFEKEEDAGYYHEDCLPFDMR